MVPIKLAFVTNDPQVGPRPPPCHAAIPPRFHRPAFFRHTRSCGSPPPFDGGNSRAGPDRPGAGETPKQEAEKNNESPGHLIKPTMPLSFRICRSLLAGDAERPTPAQSQNRLQAGSYTPTKPEQAPGYWTQLE